MKYEKFPDKCADELRTMFQDANFLETKFDNSVMGIDLDNCQVIYHEWYMIYTIIKENKGKIYKNVCDEEYWDVLYEECEKTVFSIEKLGSVSSNESLPPKVCRDTKELCSFSLERSLEHFQF